MGVPPLVTTSPFAHILVPSEVNMILVSIMFSPRTAEVMMVLAWWKLVYAISVIIIHEVYVIGSHISFSLFMPISLKLYTCVYIPNTNANKVLIWQHQIFYICKPNLFLHIYNHFGMFGSHTCFFFQMPMKFVMQFINISNFPAIFVLYVIIM